MGTYHIIHRDWISGLSVFTSSQRNFNWVIMTVSALFMTANLAAT